MIILHHDFETYSPVELKTAGTYRYVEDPGTEVLMLSYALPGDAPSLWVPAEGEPMPEDLREYIRDPSIRLAAFNARFERLVWWHVLREQIPIERFYCVMQHAWYLSFSGALADVGKQVGLRPDHQKLVTGQKLIQRFCKPAPANHKADRYTRHTHPAEWEQFKEYCRQDVIAEREIESVLKSYPWPEQEQRLWFWDQRVNDLGLPIDRDLVRRAVRVDKEAKASAREELNEITGLTNGNSANQLGPWLESRWHPVPNMQGETLARVANGTRDLVVKRALELKMLISKTSVSKWKAFNSAVSADGYLRGMFQFGGAQRTQRWAGRVVQLHNLKSPRIPDPVRTADALFLPTDTIEMLYGDPLELLSQLVRCAITAPEGMLLAPCDLGSIESRVLGYLAGCARINRVFAEGRDTYKDFASEHYQVPYDEVTKAMRTYSKPPVLGCGFRLGAKGLIAYAEGYGVTMTPSEATKAVNTWRSLHPEVCDMWDWLEASCVKCIEEHTTHEGYGVRIRRDKNFMMIDLMSGRTLHYYTPLVTAEVPPWELEKIEAGEITEEEARRKPTVSYMGMNQDTRKWVRVYSHSGKTTENIVQAFARDVLAWHMQEITREFGWIIRGHVHDEAITLISETGAVDALARIEEIMSTTPPFAPGLLLGAKGFLTHRYTKD